jgi:hypothetical protein
MAHFESAVIVAALASAAAIAAVTMGDGLVRRPIRSPMEEQAFGPPNDSPTFFAGRNVVTIDVPYGMTVDDFIALYKLEQSRGAILRQTNAYDGRAKLQQGQTITVPLTPLLEPLHGEPPR